MASYLGIDVGTSTVKVVLLRSSYRRLAVQAMAEIDRASAPTLVEAVRAAAGPFALQGESVAVNLEGERTFARRVEIPETAQRQLAEVLPFELEAELPFELSEAVYDHLVLRRGPEETIPVLAVVARTEDVRARIALVKDAIQLEPERVAPGGLALASLILVAPELAGPGPIAIFDLEEGRSEVVILEKGEPLFARTLSRGTAGLPESAPALLREFRQTMSAWRATGAPAPEVAYLVGPGASAPGAREFFSAELGLTIRDFPVLDMEVENPDLLVSLPRFAKALGLAVSLMPRSRAMNLRRGPLTYERGYGFLREKIPVLSALGVTVVLSFLFAIVAEMRAIGQEKAMLEASLSAVTKDVFGQATSDPQAAMDMLDKSVVGADEDPLPHADAFDLMVQLSENIPDSMTHDIEELDVARGHAAVHGIVPSIPDSEQIKSQLKNFKCFQDVKIVRTTQVVNEDRHKYALELDIKCPEEGKDKDKDKGGSSSAGSAAPSASGGKP
jgi:general secretion pathway protein L